VAAKRTRTGLGAGTGTGTGTASSGGSTGRSVALLRAINVGGRNIVPMKDLVALFAGAGCTNVSTYIQSGNVVFRAPPALAARLPVLLAKAVEDRFGIRVPVVVRAAGQLREVVRHNPFLRAGADPNTLHVAFLDDAPSAARIATLDPDRSPPDEFAVRGQEIYLRFPKGLGRTKLTNQYFDAKLATTSTVRNWRTVLKLLDLTGG
jgi:uncharacterized protein (DUF1697 family)